MNFNSSEPGCDGSDPNVLMCDDFESGAWYSLNCDIANTAGGLLQTHGWCGTIYADPITPAGAAVCGSKGPLGTNCAAHAGQQTGGAGAVNMNSQPFSGGPGTERVARRHNKPDAADQWG